METWLDFGRGPLFRLCFVLMVLGLLRTLAFSVVGIIRARNRAGDKNIPWGQMVAKTFAWLIPLKKLWTARPIYSLVSFLWHIGLILVPLFLAAHVLLWRNSMGFAWFSIPQNVADILTITTIIGSLLLFIMRVGNRDSRFLSRPQDIIWPLLLLVPFATGALCTQTGQSASMYQFLMLVHVYSANLIMVLIPFTKVAHCVLLPISQFIGPVGWKLTFGGGDKVAATLGKGDMPV